MELGCERGSWGVERVILCKRKQEWLLFWEIDMWIRVAGKGVLEGERLVDFG